MTQFVVAFGNAFDGTRLEGPFADFDDAREYAETAADQEWVVVELNAPTDRDK